MSKEASNINLSKRGFTQSELVYIHRWLLTHTPSVQFKDEDALECSGNTHHIMTRKGK